MKHPHSIPGVWIHGVAGRMGCEITACLTDEKTPLRLVGGSGKQLDGHATTAPALAKALEKADAKLVLDFSTPDANEILRQALALGHGPKPAVVIGTTGLPASTLAQWRSLASAQQLRILLAPNTSLGVLVLSQLAKVAARVLTPLGYDLEIIETHHRKKQDAPSGTARFLAATVQSARPELTPVEDRQGARQAGQIGVHAVRGGGVFGEHQLRFLSEHDELALSHRAFSRGLFAQGALVLSQWLLQREAGFYELADVELDSLVTLLAPRHAIP